MARVIVHKAAIKKFLFSDECFEMLAGHADRVLVACQTRAPKGKSGAYSRSFFAQRSGHRTKGSRYYAAAMLVGSSDQAAAQIEWGSRNNRATHTMAAAFWSCALP